jgi:RNA polymerase sigma-70 factor (ECF subfamily)
MNATTSHAALAIEELYMEHQHSVLIYLNRLVSDRDAAEDLCQETFIRALRGWDKRDTTRSAAAWLYRIARNAAYDELRRRRLIAFVQLNANDGWHVDEDQTPEVRLSEQESVRQALAQLAPSYRVPLVLHSCAGYSVKQISTALNCPHNTIKTRLYRARAYFQRAYNQYS